MKRRALHVSTTERQEDVLMRYGIVLDDRDLPPIAMQKAAVEAAGCDIVVEEGPPTPMAQRRLTRLLSTVKAGDVVMASRLEAFMRPLGPLTVLLRNLLEVGATVRILDDPPLELTSSPELLALLTALAEHDVRYPARAEARRQHGGSRNPLSKYQIEYAKKLHAEGMSLRSIGLLFQISPNQVWEIVGG